MKPSSISPTSAHTPTVRSLCPWVAVRYGTTGREQGPAITRHLIDIKVLATDTRNTVLRMRRLLKRNFWFRALVTTVTSLWLVIATGPCLADMIDCPVMPSPCHASANLVMPDCPMLTAGDTLPGDIQPSLYLAVSLPAWTALPLPSTGNATDAPPPTAFDPPSPRRIPLFLTHLALLR